LLLSGTAVSDTSYDTGLQPSAVAAGDLNLDSRQDVVVANEGSATISVFLGSGKGRLLPRSDYPTGLAPSAVAVGNLNGDGAGDVVVANRGSNTISIFLGTGAGGLATSTQLPVGNAPAGVAIKDVNGDGLPNFAASIGTFGRTSLSSKVSRPSSQMVLQR